MNRRRFLGVAAGGSTALVAGCVSISDSSPTTEVRGIAVLNWSDVEKRIRIELLEGEEVIKDTTYEVAPGETVASEDRWTSEPAGYVLRYRVDNERSWSEIELAENSDDCTEPLIILRDDHSEVFEGTQLSDEGEQTC